MSHPKTFLNTMEGSHCHVCHGQAIPHPFTYSQQPVKIFCRADENFCLTVRNDQVVLAPANPCDPFQQWIKDLKQNTVKDEEGFPAFSLVNKATGRSIKHSLDQSHPVQLMVPYNPAGCIEESVLWTESEDVGNGFRCIRVVNNISLTLDAFHGDKDHSGVHDGTIVVLSNWCNGANQSWKIVPYSHERIPNPVQRMPCVCL